MSDEHTTTVDRLRQFETQRTTDAMNRAEEARKTDAVERGTFLAGSRVLDVITGLEGVVLPRGFTVSPASKLVAVRLDRGDMVIRPPQNLMPRPTPPSV